jgi:hypothetical protein
VVEHMYALADDAVAMVRPDGVRTARAVR